MRAFMLEEAALARATMTRLVRQTLSARVFCTLSARERHGIAELLRLGAVPGDPISDAERRATRDAVLRLPWLLEQRPGAGERHALASLSFVEDPSLHGRLARSLAASFPRAEVRDRVFRALLALFFADGGAQRDMERLEPFRRGLGIEVARALEIQDELESALFLVGK